MAEAGGGGHVETPGRDHVRHIVPGQVLMETLTRGVMLVSYLETQGGLPQYQDVAVEVSGGGVDIVN